MTKMTTYDNQSIHIFGDLCGFLSNIDFMGLEIIYHLTDKLDYVYFRLYYNKIEMIIDNEEEDLFFNISPIYFFKDANSLEDVANKIQNKDIDEDYIINRAKKLLNIMVFK